MTENFDPSALLLQMARDVNADREEVARRYSEAVGEVLNLAAALERRSDNVLLHRDGRGSERVATLREVAEQIRSVVASRLVVPQPLKAREPRRWPVGSPEPVEKGLRVEVPNGVTFRRSPWNDWEAEPPIGDGRRYRWAQINHGSNGTAVVEVLEAAS